MTQDMNALLAELEALRLPELKERYEQVVGKQTRCPNRTFLIRTICNALGTPTEATAGPAETTASTAPTLADKPVVPLSATDGAPHTGVAPAAQNARSDARSAPADCPRRRRVEHLPRGRFSSMTVEELQRKYIEVVGRGTASSARAYLVWKIREAEKGRIPVGPRRTCAREGEPIEVKILPLRLEADTVEAMDEAWRTRGIKNRMDFLRRALGHYLTHLGATDAAAKLALAASA